MSVHVTIDMYKLSIYRLFFKKTDSVPKDGRKSTSNSKYIGYMI